MMPEALQQQLKKGRKLSKAAKRLISSGRNNTDDGCIWSIYVDWVQASAARVVPVPWNTSVEDMATMFDNLNGILFPGGVLHRASSLYQEYLNKMCDIYDEVVRRAARGDNVPLWGTCEGFQMIQVCAANRNISVLQGGFVGTDGPAMMRVNFTGEGWNDDMFHEGYGFPTRLRHAMETENTTLNWHSLGVEPHQYKTNSALNASGMVPLATTNDFVGRTFVSAAQSKIAPVYSVQFHPERVMFQFHRGITHPRNGIEISEYLSLFLMEKMRLNNHSYPSPADAEARLIANYPVVNVGWGVRIYYV